MRIKTVLMYALMYLILGTTLGSCLKLPEPKIDFGPSVSFDDVDKALGKLATTSPTTIQKGEFVYTETTLRVESQPAQVSKQEALTVIQRQDSESQIFLSVTRQLVEEIDSQSKPSKTEIQVTINKNPKRTIADNLSLKSLLAPLATDSETGSVGTQVMVNPFKEVASEVKTFADNNNRNVTFHNLKVENLTVSAPLLVQIGDKCNGLDPSKCQSGLSAVRVSVDQVIWEAGTPNKTSYMWVTSPDVPYLAGQMLGCAMSLVPYRGARYNVLQCNEVKNFTFGTNSAAQ